MKTVCQTRNRGFTLIELMVVVSIIAILLGIAIPSYQEYIVRGKRAEAHARLNQFAQLLERYYSDNGTYSGVALGPLIGLAAATTVYSGASNASASAYTMAFSGTTSATQFTLTATPNGWTDSKCGVLWVNNAGVKGTRQDGTTDDSPAVPGCW